MCWHGCLLLPAILDASRISLTQIEYYVNKLLHDVRRRLVVTAKWHGCAVGQHCMSVLGVAIGQAICFGSIVKRCHTSLSIVIEFMQDELHGTKTKTKTKQKNNEFSLSILRYGSVLWKFSLCLLKNFHQITLETVFSYPHSE